MDYINNETTNFKVGDKVRRVSGYAGTIPLGTVLVIDEIECFEDEYQSLGFAGYIGYFYGHNFELVKE